MRRLGLLLALLAAVGCRDFLNIYDPANNRPPVEPFNPSPAPGSTDLDTLGQVLTWESADPDSIAADALTYDVFFGTQSQPPLVDSNRTVTRYETGRLAVGAMYYWRIIARDTRGDSAAGPVWSFATDDNLVPAVPGNPRPPDGILSRKPGQELAWTGDDPNAGDTLEYDLYFGTDANPPLLVRGLATAGYRPAGQVFGARYYWRVVARDQDSAETSGPTWSFETMAAVQVTRPDAGTRWRGGTTHDITWTGGADGAGSQKSEARKVKADAPARRGIRNSPFDTRHSVVPNPGPLPAAADSTVIFYTTDNGSSWERAGRATEENRFTWSLPPTEAAQARVRVVVHAGADTVAATSPAFEIYRLPSDITVTRPGPGARWRVGSTEAVTWTGGTDGADSTVVFYSPDGGANWSRQGRATEPGRYDWTVAGPETDRGQVEVRAYVADEKVWGRSGRFEAFQFDSIVVTAPTDSSRFRWYSYATFTWDGGSANADSTVVYFRRVDSDPWTRLGRQSAPGRYENYLWPPIEPSVECRVRVTAHRYGLSEEGLSPRFEVYNDSQPSAMTITAPAGGERWAIGSSQVITWLGGTDGVDSTVVLYSTDNGNQWQRQGVTRQPGRFEWTVPGPATGLARIGLVAWCLTRQTQALSEQFAVIQP